MVILHVAGNFIRPIGRQEPHASRSIKNPMAQYQTPHLHSRHDQCRYDKYQIDIGAVS